MHIFSRDRKLVELWSGSVRKAKTRFPKQPSRSLVGNPESEQEKEWGRTRKTRSWHPGKQASGGPVFMFSFVLKEFIQKVFSEEYFSNSRSWPVYESQNKFSGHSPAFLNEIEKMKIENVIDVLECICVRSYTPGPRASSVVGILRGTSCLLGLSGDGPSKVKSSLKQVTQGRGPQSRWERQPSLEFRDQSELDHVWMWALVLQRNNPEEMSLKSEWGGDQVQGKGVTSYDGKEMCKLELWLFGQFWLAKMAISYI